MTAPISDTPTVSRAIAAANDLPGLVANLQATAPALAQQLTGKPLLASKSVYGPAAVAAVTWVAGKYGFNWDANTVDLVAGAAVLVASAAFRWVSTGPITSLFVKKTTAPAPQA